MLWILIFLSALLLSLSFSTFNLSFLAWIGLIPLFFAIEINKEEAPKTDKWIFGISYLCGFLFFLFSMYWLVYVTPAGWILLSLYQAIYFGIFGLLCSHILKTYNLQPATYISIPSIWCLLEYLRSHIAGGIGWNLLAYSQYKNTPFIQIADITGAYGVSFLIVMVNFGIFAVIRMAIKCQKKEKAMFVKSNLPFSKEIRINPLFQTLAVFFAIIAVLVYGSNRIESLERNGASLSERIKISIIQGNIEQLHKWDKLYKTEIMEKYRKLTLEAAKDRPDLIIWPETSLPGYPDKDKSIKDYIENLVKQIKIPLLAGAPIVATKDGIDIGDYNSALIFSKRGRLLEQYNKLHLVIFGEFIPFERYLPWLRGFFPLTGKFVSGDEYTLFKQQTKFGVLICFEDIFPDLVRKFITSGASLMVNITNDAWFGKTAAAYQHAGNSVFRAVENRRPFIRSANTGLSCFIDEAGRIYDTVVSDGRELFIAGYTTNTVKIDANGALTFYTRFGNIFILLCLLIVGLFLIDYLYGRRYNK